MYPQDPLFMPDQPSGESIEFTISNGLNLSMVWCGPGHFNLGTPLSYSGIGIVGERPVQHVRIERGFWMGRFPMTNDIYNVIIPSQPYGAGPRYPVDTLSWFEAVEFCQVLTRTLLTERGVRGCRFELPLEIEWEYACRAGTESKWYFGDDESDLVDHAWYSLNSANRPHPVGLKLPNSWGLYDLYGNVSEWCLDQFWSYQNLDDHLRTVEDKPAVSRMTRGGDYYSIASQCRSASRATGHPHNAYNDPIGVRVILKEIDC